MSERSTAQHSTVVGQADRSIRVSQIALAIVVLAAISFLVYAAFELPRDENGLETWTTVAAFTAAGVFFLLRVYSGLFFANADLSITLDRHALSETEDVLSVTATFRREDSGAVKLHDVACFARRVDPRGGEVATPNVVEMFGQRKREVGSDGIIRREPSDYALQLNPKDVATFAGFTTVLASEIVIVEMIVAGNSLMSPFAEQWTGAAVSVPRTPKERTGLARFFLWR